MKKLLAAALAFSMVFCFTACSEKDDDDSNSSSKNDSSAVKPEVKDDSSEAESSKEDPEESSKEESSEDDSSEVDDGSFYDYEIDETKWTSTTAAGVDNVYYYTAGDDINMSTASINFVSASDPSPKEFTSADYAEQIEAAYGAMEGYTITGQKEIEFNGNQGYEVSVSMDSGTYTMTMKQVVVCKGEHMVVVSYGAMDSVFDELSSEFQAVLDTVTID